MPRSMQTLLIACVFSVVNILPGQAQEIHYKPEVSLKVGQSVIVKGVRGNDCGNKAPSWNHIKSKLPRSKTGKFSNGGTGTVESNKCGKSVGARAVKFKAMSAGGETLKIYGDTVKFTVQ